MKQEECKDCICLFESEGKLCCGSHSDDEITTFENCPEKEIYKHEDYK